MDPDTSRAIEEDQRFEVMILTQGLMGAGDLATCRKIRDQERSRGIVRGLAQIAVEQGLLDPSQLASQRASHADQPTAPAPTSHLPPTPSPGFQNAEAASLRPPSVASGGMGSVPAMTPGGTEVALPRSSLDPSRQAPAATLPPSEDYEVVEQEPTATVADGRTDADVDAAMLGHEVAGFRILDVLGRGAMGTVFRAHQTSLERDVAFKVLASRYTDDEEFIERFHREAKAAGRFNHPNVVSGIDCGTTQINDLEIHYFVMELVVGKPLSEIMSARGPFPEPEALRITRAVLDALGRAHDVGLVHRDVKPENILIDSEQKPKLADLGLAKDLRRGSSLTVEGLVMGTPNYMAPEQATGEGTLDGRADLYALGISLYEMLTAGLPFKDDSPMIVLTMHVNNDVPSPHTVRPDLSPATCAIVTGLCQRRPAQRYAHAKTAMADIDHVLAMIQAGRTPPASSLPSRSSVAPTSSRPSPSSMPAAGSPPTRKSTAPAAPMRTRSSSGDLAVATPGRTPRGRHPSSRRLASMRSSSQRLAMASPGSRKVPHQLVPVVIAVASAALMAGFLIWLSNRPTSPPEVSVETSSNSNSLSQLAKKVNKRLDAAQYREAAAVVFDQNRKPLNEEEQITLAQLQEQVLKELEAGIDAQIKSGRYTEAMSLLNDIAAGNPEAKHKTSAMTTKVQDHLAQAEDQAIEELIDSVPYKCRGLQFDAANEALDSAPLVSERGMAWRRLLRDMVREVDLTAIALDSAANGGRLPSLGELLAFHRLGDLIEPGLGLGPMADEALISTERPWVGPNSLANDSRIELERLLQKSACLALSLSRLQDLAIIIEMARRHGVQLDPLLAELCDDHREAAKQRVDLGEIASSLLDTDGNLRAIEESLDASIGASNSLGDPGAQRRDALRTLARARQQLDRGDVEQVIAVSTQQLPAQNALWPLEWLELSATSTTASMVQQTRLASSEGLVGAASEAEQVLARAQQAGVSPLSHGGPLGRSLELSIGDAGRTARILIALHDLGQELEQTKPDLAAVTQLVTSSLPIKSACQDILSGPPTEQGPSLYARTIRDQLMATTLFVESMERLIQEGPQAAEQTLDSIELIDPERHFRSACQREMAALRKLIQAGAEVMARATAEAARRREQTPPGPGDEAAPPPVDPADPKAVTPEEITVKVKKDLKQGFKLPNTWGWEGGLINNAQSVNTFLRSPMALSPNGGRVHQVSLVIDLQMQHRNHNMPVVAVSTGEFTCFISQDKLGLHAGGPRSEWMVGFVDNLYGEANLEIAPANPNNAVRPWPRGVYVLDIKIEDLNPNQPHALEVTASVREQNARRSAATLTIVARATASKRTTGLVQLHLFQKFHVTDLTILRERPDDEKAPR